MLRVRVLDDAIRIGRHFAVSFQRTLRIPDDGGVYPLPPGLGRFPLGADAGEGDVDGGAGATPVTGLRGQAGLSRV